MRPVEIESWVLAVIQQVEDGQPNEDARVEMKAEWIDSFKASRQIAGHANAARGDPILWLIGVDQETGVVGVDHKELATWLPKISSRFDGVAPDISDINVPYRNKTVVALLVSTERAPFVIKNPDFGSKSGVSIAFEVPWRDGTTTRTATRSDLIQILVPKLALPEIELLDTELSLSKHDKYRWYLKMELYITPKIGSFVVIPFHRCEVELILTPSNTTIPLSGVRLVPPYKPVPGRSLTSWEPDSLTAAHTRTELIIDGPARVNLSAEAWMDDAPLSLEDSSITIRTRLHPVHANQSLMINPVLKWSPSPDQDVIASWKHHQ